MRCHPSIRVQRSEIMRFKIIHAGNRKGNTQATRTQPDVRERRIKKDAIAKQTQIAQQTNEIGNQNQIQGFTSSMGILPCQTNRVDNASATTDARRNAIAMYDERRESRARRSETITVGGFSAD